MPVLAGVDGCPGGWLCISKDLGDGRIDSRVYTNAEALIIQKPQPLLIAVDIPIGLTDSGPRQCDKCARQLLGEPRRRSVFPAPIRGAITAHTRLEADALNRSADGRGVGAQAWGLYKKIRDIDHVLGKDPALQRVVHEVHPELSFMIWNGGVLISAVKKTLEGKAARCALVKAHFGQDAFRIVREKHQRRIVSDDDINDAFAALWTAERIHNGTALVIPSLPEIDPLGLRMEIWY
jgi:predicted RNase H-like nuclease